MALSAVQLDELHKAWSGTVLSQIKSFGQGSPETLSLHIEAEKVSLLYQIAIQLALMNSKSTV
jgi:hypothetical protein